jgi:hypothetical protein
LMTSCCDVCRLDSTPRRRGSRRPRRLTVNNDARIRCALTRRGSAPAFSRPQFPHSRRRVLDCRCPIVEWGHVDGGGVAEQRC